MDKLHIFVLLFFTALPAFAQVDYTANDAVTPYDGGFRPGLNSGEYPGFSDELLGDLAAGNALIGNKGVGAKALRPGLFESFTEQYGVDSRVETFEHYLDLGIEDNTVIVGFPGATHQDLNFYCPAVQSQMFANMYEPIWDDGSDGTPYNENNYYAAYLWEVVNTYQGYVKFWEIWNEPGFDYTGNKGFLPPGAPGNWWENNPEPCDYKLRAPIFHYVRLLRISWEIIKSIDETAYVAVSGTGYPSFLDAILRNTDNPLDGSVTEEFPLGGGAYFDVFGFHFYPHFDNSLREYDDEIQDFVNFRHSDAAAQGVNFNRNLYQDVLDEYGYDGATYPEKLWTITECNLPRVPYGDFIGSDEAQRNFMIKTYVECVVQDFVQLDVYKIAEDKTDETATYEFDLMGLYYKLSIEDGYFNEPTDGGIALRTATDLLFEKEYDAERTAALALPDDVAGAAFADANGAFTYVLWAKTTIDMSEEASATYSFPAAWNMGTAVKRLWNFGATSVTEIIDGENIALTGAPIFLTEQIFSADNLSGCAPLQIQFSDLSAGSAVTWEWDFTGDGAPITSSVQNPQITFFIPGCYTATMQAYGADGTLTAMQTQEIEVFEPTESAFTYAVNGPAIDFFNQASINTQTFHWDFGDGNTSNEPTPQHVYFTAGEYTVTLTTSNQCAPATSTQTVSVNPPSIYYVDYSANDLVPTATGNFRVGYNFGYYPGWTDEDLANIAAGNPAENIEGIGARTVRTWLGEFFVNFWGYDVRSSAFAHYADLGITDATLTLDFPSDASKDLTEYCPGDNSALFKNLYHEIWDDGTDGTPINDENPYAVYVYNMVQTYGEHVKYWEIMNSPDFDLTGETGYLPPGEPNNWWDNNPEPCDYTLRAPIYHYIRTLRISYEIIKYLQPDDYVAVSGIGFPSFLDAVLRNTDNPADGSVAPGFERGGGAYFDVLGIKSFPHFDGTTSYFNLDIGGFAYERHSDKAANGIAGGKEQFTAVLENYGYGTTYPAKEWIIAEANVPRLQFDEFLGGEVVQRNWIMKAYVAAVKNDIRQLNIFNLTERAAESAATTPFDVMGLYQNMNAAAVGEQVVNLEGIALRTTSALLYGRSYDAARTAEMALPEEADGAAFQDASGDYVYVLWAKTDTDMSEANTAMYSFPAAFGLTEVYKRIWNYGATDATESIAPTDIALTASPIFLTASENVLQAPTAAFSADMQTGCPGATVQFSDNSVGEEISYFWEFAGGTPATSTAANPTVTYDASGNFAVSLTVTNAVNSHTVTAQDYVEITPAPVANFGADIDGAWAQFTNGSTAADFFEWNFGDSDFIGNGNTPQHFYFANGTYEVTLIAYNDCFSDTTTQTIVIAAAPTPEFTFGATGDCATSSVAFFNNTYSSPESFLWEFEEGNPALSDEMSPQVVFPQGGVYTVTLTATNEFGSNTTTQEVFVPGNSLEYYSGTLCDGESAEVEGVIFDSENLSGTVVLQGVNGCDSMLQVSFALAENYEIDLVEVIAAGESFTVGNSVFTETGEYSVLLQSVAQCDSLVNLDLTVLTSTAEIALEKFAFSVSPNPFAETTAVRFSLPEAGIVSLTLTDVFGQTVRDIYADELFAAGERVVVFEEELAAGVYFFRLRVGEEEVVLRVVRV